MRVLAPSGHPNAGLVPGVTGQSTTVKVRRSEGFSCRLPTLSDRSIEPGSGASAQTSMLQTVESPGLRFCIVR